MMMATSLLWQSSSPSQTLAAGRQTFRVQFILLVMAYSLTPFLHSVILKIHVSLSESTCSFIHSHMRSCNGHSSVCIFIPMKETITMYLYSLVLLTNTKKLLPSPHLSKLKMGLRGPNIYKPRDRKMKVIMQMHKHKDMKEHTLSRAVLQVV